jgi:hypothetical protein
VDNPAAPVLAHDPDVGLLWEDGRRGPEAEARHEGVQVTDGPVDFIRLEGQDTSVVLRITGMRDDESAQVLDGEFLVETPFVRGSLQASVVPDDVWEWRDALDGLDAGNDVAWRAEGRGASMTVERAGDQAYVTIKDATGSATTVTVTVPLTDQWFDDAYGRLDLTLKTWPLPED